MTTPALAIVGAGMVSGVGLNAPASCAAIRCAIDNFQETRFMDMGGEWIQGSSVPLEQPWRGRIKLVKMLALALRECFASDPQIEPNQVPLLLCVAEEERPGRLEGIDKTLFSELQTELDVRFHAKSRILAQGRVTVAEALQYARQLIYKERIPRVIIAGADSLLVAATLRTYEEQERLLTDQNHDGFLPGEAAAAVLVTTPRPSAEPQLLCLGIGEGLEKATVMAEEVPLRADGLVQAIKAALAEAGCNMGDLDFRITDLSGEQYGFKEAALALTRILRVRKEEFDIWHPADCIGEVGAAIGPAILTIALLAARKGYLLGNRVLCHFGNDAGKRAALVLSYQKVRAD
jgi:3-oxoacyl-[acyl-carrier-protein] synthase-1